MKRSPVNGCACGDYCRNIMEAWLRWLAGQFSPSQMNAWRAYCRGDATADHSAVLGPLPYPIQPGAY